MSLQASALHHVQKNIAWTPLNPTSWVNFWSLFISYFRVPTSIIHNHAKQSYEFNSHSHATLLAKSLPCDTAAFTIWRTSCCICTLHLSSRKRIGCQSKVLQWQKQLVKSVKSSRKRSRFDLSTHSLEQGRVIIGNVCNRWAAMLDMTADISQTSISWCKAQLWMWF